MEYTFLQIRSNMNKKALNTLEYYKIIDKLTSYASSEMGKSICRELLPLNDINNINSAQIETSDALSRIWKKGSISFSGLKDITPSIKRLLVGASLGPGELLAISTLLDTALKVKTFSRKENDQEENDSLDEMFFAIEPLSPLNNEIKKCIIAEDEISDDASPALKNIRRKIKNTNDQIHSQLTSLISSQSMKTYLQDFVVTMRNGRYCIPVKQEHKNNVPGMIHDQSSSGSTLFIEPMAVVKLNNDLKELFGNEQDEIDIILANLSNLAAEHTDTLASNLSILVKLDFIFAKAAYSKSYKGSEPEFNSKGYINIKCGRHPLLDPKTVVPTDIRLGKDYNMLIVTGPNTGGKTVSLKTTGLLSLMGQSGLHIPADQGSSLSVFEEIYADIGDEQSIEQSLSTFSSHMKNIINIIDKADEKSLVLFDELGAGTDPTEGAALAISILIYLNNLQVRTMATTHYSELKVFALETIGVENASCEFDVESLRPTYKLLIGIPGKSNAFEISRKLGLPDFIIEQAKEKITTNDKSFEDLLTSLERSRVTIEKEQKEIENYKTEIETLKKKIVEKHENLDERKDRILRKANEEAQEILQEAKDFADLTIKNINKLSKGSGMSELEKQRQGLGKKLKDINQKLTLKNKESKTGHHKPEDFHLGDSVKVLSLGLEGSVSSLPNAKGDVYVQMGILRSQVNISDLVIIDEPTITGPNLQKTNSGKIKMSKSSALPMELNIIGKNVDDGLAALDKYLDDAYLSHLPFVRIVHGKGTGTLRNAVHGFLKKSKNVKSYKLAEFGEGDAGVTIVEFKQ